MTDQSGSACFQSLVESALQDYKKKTGIILAEHPLMAELESSHAVEDITVVLQRQVEAVSDLKAKDRITKWIKTTVSILTPLSNAASLTDAVGLVRQSAQRTCFLSLTVLMQAFPPPAQAVQAGLAILLDVRAVL
jgi:hypothetical protein